MKYYAFKPGVLRYFGLPPKILLIMKLIVVILTTFLMQVSAAGLAQKITYTQKNASLEEVFDEITKQTGYNVLWPGTRLNTAHKVQANFKNANLEDVLNKVLANLPMSFTIDTKTIVISEIEPTFLERLAERWASIDVVGRVVDAEGKALPGATVKVKATGKGVSTDVKGNFHLKNVEEGAVLVVSYTGYVSKEVKASINMGNIVLEQSLSKLDEIQVIAYGTTTQRLSTGNVTTIKADVIEKQPVNNPLLALQGRVPGLFIEQATGFAGTGVKVRIQGTNSLINGNDPLYVIDGVPFTSQLMDGGNTILGRSDFSAFGNPLSFINPSDIESIDVLKDADATSIYGSRAANGAILITTKKGKAGDIVVNVNVQNGFGKVSNKLNLMNTQQYLEMRNEAYKNDNINLNLPPYNSELLKILSYPDLSFWDKNRYTDWQKELIGGTANYNDIKASVSGGSAAIQFILGAGYHKETNVFPGEFNDEKSSIHFSVNSTSANQRFKIQFSGSYQNDNNQLPQVDLTGSAILLPPNAPALYTSIGGVNWEPTPSGKNSTFLINPIALLHNRFKNITTNLIGSSTMIYRILPGLDIKNTIGYTSLLSNITSTIPISSIPPEYQQYYSRKTTFGLNRIASWSIEPQLTYNFNALKGKFEVLLGTTIQKESRDGSSVVATGFNTDQVMEDIKSATLLTAGSSISSIYKYNAVFGRVNYNWDDKYILNFAARRDGSSRFGSENQFHNFGSLGAAWIFSQEHRIKEILTFLSFGKIRASYGTTGSDQIGDYKTLSFFSSNSYLSAPYQGTLGYLPDGLANPYLQWEETKKLQIGLDLGFLKDRILLNTNYSVNRSSNQLLPYSLPYTAGFINIISNFPATIQNTGWEFTISTINLNSREFKWSSSFNLTIPKNKLVKFVNLVNSPYADNFVIGKSVNIRKVFHFSGIDPQTGNYMFLDKDGNSTTTPVNGIDSKIINNTDPEFYGGLQNTFSYKGFQLDILLQFTKQFGINNQIGIGRYIGSLNNQPMETINRWQKPGDVTPIGRYSNNLSSYGTAYTRSDANWGDASYVRLKNLSVSWQIPKQWKKAICLQNCKLYVQGENLLTITDYLGLDPESKSSLTLPPLRIITMGFQIGI